MVRTENTVDMSIKEATAVGNVEYWIGEALARGLIVTVERVPLSPPAMGHAETVVTVRRAIDHNGEAAVRREYAK